MLLTEGTCMARKIFQLNSKSFPKNNNRLVHLTETTFVFRLQKLDF